LAKFSSFGFFIGFVHRQKTKCAKCAQAFYNERQRASASCGPDAYFDFLFKYKIFSVIKYLNLPQKPG
jgi:hypothetical protein